MAALFLEASLCRLAEFNFALECSANLLLNAKYNGYDALADKLLNNFARGYFQPAAVPSNTS
eukprot:4620382-Pleurochrysis_carterae.AAC.1